MSQRLPLFAVLLLATCLPATTAHAVEEMWRRESRTTVPPSDYAMMHPIIIPWTDDNGDGRIDEADGGDVLYVGTENRVADEGIVRLLEGHTGRLLWDFERPTGVTVGASITLAAGDVDGDGFPELVVGCGTEQSNDATILMYNWDGSVRWLRNVSTSYGGTSRTITLTDLDGDGFAEILASNEIIDRFGTFVRRLQVPHCAESYPVDIDLDGVVEIACGTSVARQDGTAVFTGANAELTMVPVQWDSDPMPEFAVSGWGVYSFRIFDSDGTVLFQDEDDWIAWRKMPFAAADVDLDGKSEIYFGERNPLTNEEFLSSYAPDVTNRWRVPSDDSLAAGGSLAWLDGRLTFLHNDLGRFFGVDTRDGSEIMTLPVMSVTYWELPAFVDLDGDGIGELVTTDSSAPEPAVQAWRDPSWCPARAVFNQHSYVSDFIGPDLRPAGPPATPIDWAHSGFRQQRNDCPCTDPPVVTIQWEPDCVPGTSCFVATVTPPRRPLRVTWTLPDGSTSTDARPCVPHAEGADITVRVEDGVNCTVTEVLTLAAQVERTVDVVLEADCIDPSIQCARAELVGMVDPVDLSWTLPDGTSSMDVAPCFSVTGPGTISLSATDALGCALALDTPVDTYVPPVMVEVSAPSSRNPLLAFKRPGGIVVTWEPSLSGLRQALWSGTIGTWGVHAAIACAAPTFAVDARNVASVYYLAGELDCAAASGPLGNTSLGDPRPTPPSGCW